MDITINFQEADDKPTYENNFSSIDSAVEYLERIKANILHEKVKYVLADDDL